MTVLEVVFGESFPSLPPQGILQQVIFLTCKESVSFIFSVFTLTVEVKSSFQ